jgi:hypothetical protein
MLGEARESQLRQAFEKGLIPIHVANALRVDAPIFEGEANRACSAISEGYEEGTCEYRELYQYILHYAKLM